MRHGHSEASATEREMMVSKTFLMDQHDYLFMVVSDLLMVLRLKLLRSELKRQDA